MTKTPLVVGLVGSPRPRGNTAHVVGLALEELAAAGATCESHVLGTLQLRYCEGHDDCEEWDECPLADDAEPVLERMWQADCLVVGSPVYGDNVSGQLKVLLDRCCHRHNHGLLLRASALGLVAVSAGSGLDETLDAMERGLAMRFAAPVPTRRLAGLATYLGDAGRDAGLERRARELGRELAELLGLSPA